MVVWWVLVHQKRLGQVTDGVVDRHADTGVVNNIIGLAQEEWADFLPDAGGHPILRRAQGAETNKVIVWQARKEHLLKDAYVEAEIKPLNQLG